MCIASDASHTYLGRCGEDSPLVSIPTSLDPLPCFDGGAIKDWEALFTTWWKGLEHLEVSLLVIVCSANSKIYLMMLIYLYVV